MPVDAGKRLAIYCTQCLPYVDILLGIEPYHLWNDEERPQPRATAKDGVPLQPSYEQQDEVFQRFRRPLPQPQVHRPPRAATRIPAARTA